EGPRASSDRGCTARCGRSCPSRTRPCRGDARGPGGTATAATRARERRCSPAPERSSPCGARWYALRNVDDDATREVREQPLDEQRRATARADELHEVVRPPHGPGEDAGEHQVTWPLELRGRAGATERDEVTLALVPIWLKRLAAHEVRDVLRRRRRLEHGDLREHRERRAEVVECRGVAEGQYVVAAAPSEELGDDDPAVLRLRQIERREERVGPHAAGPDDGVR